MSLALYNVIPVIYIQLDGVHVGFCPDGGPIVLTLPPIIITIH